MGDPISKACRMISGIAGAIHASGDDEICNCIRGL